VTHQWTPTTTPPPAPVSPAGQCDNVAGQICAWNDITVGELTGAIGYTWQAFGSTPPSCGGSGQIDQLGNVSLGASPQPGYLLGGCGFSGVVKIVYDLMGTSRNFYVDPTPTQYGAGTIRQIRLQDGGPSSFDPPGSNLAWGALQFPCDAAVLHPQGKIISLSSANHKMEVVDLTTVAVADASAPTSRVYCGQGTLPARLNAPILAAVSPQGNVLVLEQGNNRVQAFDLNGNAVPQFASNTYFFPLNDNPVASSGAYLDLAVEYTGYIYVLSYVPAAAGSYVYRLDIYTPQGAHLAQTTGIYAARIAIDRWRNVYTLNYQPVMTPSGQLGQITEPSVSQWIPSV